MQPAVDFLDQMYDLLPNYSPTSFRYIERFRHGAPMSKAERLRNQATNPGDFWWLSSSTPPTPTSSSTPRDEQQEGEEKRGERGRKVTSANSYASPLLNKGAAKRLSTGSSVSGFRNPQNSHGVLLGIGTFKIITIRYNIDIYWTISYLDNIFNNTACLPGT